MIKVLVIEDKEMRKFLKDYFERDKTFRVFTPATQEEVLTTVAKERPQVALLDIWMSLWTLEELGTRKGLDTLKKIKEVDPSIKVVVITAIDDKKVMDEASRLGADDYFIKPFNLDYLDRVITKRIRELAREEV